MAGEKKKKTNIYHVVEDKLDFFMQESVNFLLVYMVNTQFTYKLSKVTPKLNSKTCTVSYY